MYSWFRGVMGVSVDFVVETYSLFFGATFQVCICVEVWWRSWGQDVVKRL